MPNVRANVMMDVFAEPELGRSELDRLLAKLGIELEVKVGGVGQSMDACVSPAGNHDLGRQLALVAQEVVDGRLQDVVDCESVGLLSNAAF